MVTNPWQQPGGRVIKDIYYADQKYHAVLPDLLEFRGLIECMEACPVQTDGRGYVLAVANGEYERGYAYARANNPFVSMCGKVCGAPCETACRRKDYDNPVSIRALKRYINNFYGVEVRDPAETLRYSHAAGTLNPPPNGHKVAIVGAGVAGLTAAHDLARLGYEVLILEMMPEPGGMMQYGVPLFRLERELIQRECEAILSLPRITLKCGVTFGKDVTWEELREQGYEALLIAVGLWQGSVLRIPGHDAFGVRAGIDFLADVALGKDCPECGKKIAVLGGGLVACDVVRTALRYAYGVRRDHPVVPEEELDPEVEVHMFTVESRQEMPSTDAEVEEFMEEGIYLHNRYTFKEIVTEPDPVHGKRVKGVITQRVARAFDEDGRFSPVIIDDSEEFWEFDTVYFAIGQRVLDNFMVGELKNLRLTPRGYIDVDFLTGATNLEGVFAAGDISVGPSLFITCIAAGQRAAAGIHEYLTGERITRSYTFEVHTIENYTREMICREEYLDYERRDPPKLDPARRRRTNDQVEFIYSKQEAVRQANRCLRCHIQPTYNSELCVLCNGCVDVCPMDCLKFVTLDEIEITDEINRFMLNMYGIDARALIEEGREDELAERATALLKDETICIRCGLCAYRCPTHAMTMDSFDIRESYVVVKPGETNGGPPLAERVQLPSREVVAG